jgi:hypothetical protein
MKKAFTILVWALTALVMFFAAGAALVFGNLGLP